MAKKTLQAAIDKIDQFEGNDIIKYLRFHIKEIKLKHVFEKEIVQLIQLASIVEIRNQVKSIIWHFGGL